MDGRDPAPNQRAAEPDTPVVDTRGLTKIYPKGDRAAVDGLDLRIGRELFGLLGPNGAGKSTTIGVLCTLVRPTAGTATVCGFDVTRDPVEVKRRIGVVSQHNTLDADLTLAENLEFRARCFGVPARTARARAGELLEQFGLTGCATSSPHQVSGGQAKRAMIARALAHSPEVLFLDEPTAGLDPQTRLHLWEVLRRLRGDGRTIVLSTHYLEEAAELCDRVAVVDHGRLLACDTVDGLTAGLTAGPNGGRGDLEGAFLALTGREYRP
jgi:ABC-2 type transport system ATP-binding protein